MRKMYSISDLLVSEPEAFRVIRQLSGREEEQSYQAGNSLHRYLWYLKERIGLRNGASAAKTILPLPGVVQEGEKQDSVALMLLSIGEGSRGELETRRNECLDYVSAQGLRAIENYCEVSGFENRMIVSGDRAAITALLNCLMLYNNALAVPR
ncbi:MAG TPA: hypothetical protein VI934_04220 [Candidatus Nanoarchaeia archaeon]|nr:hypothetical protein [Candidatus Nanoarchaeia archaeon]